MILFCLFSDFARRVMVEIRIVEARPHVSIYASCRYIYGGTV